MDTVAFLERIVAPGNFVCISYDKGDRFTNRFFPRDKLGDAVGSLNWAVRKGYETYFAMASFIVTTQETGDHGTYLRGERKAPNVHALRCLWIDLDVSRPGDGKQPGTTFATQADAIRWVAGFCDAVSLPRPNLWVSSGYGVHVYWVLDDAMSPAEWSIGAKSLKNAVLRHGFTGDAGVIADSVRVLRAPGTKNFKAGKTGKPVEVISQLTRGDYPNALVLDALVGYAPAASSGQLTLVPASSMASRLAGGRPSAALATQAAMTIPAASAAQPRHMANIVQGCAQVAGSLTRGGAGDPYPLWYLGHLSLAHHCADGSAYVHALSSGDARYDPAQVDAAVARIAGEKAVKDTGPPTCATFESANAAGCAGCPMRGRGSTPWHAYGLPPTDLPDGYRRTGTAVQRRTLDKEGNPEWLRLLAGDVVNPEIFVDRAGVHTLEFDYLVNGKTQSQTVAENALTQDPRTIYTLFANQGLGLRNVEKPWRDFILAWIDKLRQERTPRTDKPAAFGWNVDRAGKLTGFAVGGTVYNHDGSETNALHVDRELLASYEPKGTFAKWQAAANLVMAGRPDLQVLVAASFAAPLMRFTGQKGMVISAWSRQSGVGKSSALEVGQGVWASYGTMNAMDDTRNAVGKKIGDASGMPCYWDELKVNRDNARTIADMVFQLSLGKGKARMAADSSLRAVAEYETILVATANKPLMDAVTAETESTDAGALRVFEYNIVRPVSRAMASAPRIIAAVKDNHGHAGRVYAKHIAQHSGMISAAMEKLIATLNTTLSVGAEERFHIAGMAALLLGAKLANSLKLVSFDTAAIELFLKDTFDRLRSARAQNSVVSQATGYDLEQVFGSFVADNSGHRLTTSHFQTNSQSCGSILEEPTRRERVSIHVGVLPDPQRPGPSIMRVDRKAFFDWCKDHDYSKTDVLTELEARWGATQIRATLAGGTQWRAQRWTIDLPLVGDLEAYAPSPSAPTGQHQGAASSPASALAVPAGGPLGPNPPPP